MHEKLCHRFDCDHEMSRAKSTDEMFLCLLNTLLGIKSEMPNEVTVHSAEFYARPEVINGIVWLRNCPKKKLPV